MNDLEKSKLAKEGLSSFFEQFGEPDSHKEQVLLLIFELMMNGEIDDALSLHDEKKQEGIQTTNNIQGNKLPTTIKGR